MLELTREELRQAFLVGLWGARQWEVLKIDSVFLCQQRRLASQLLDETLGITRGDLEIV